MTPTAAQSATSAVTTTRRAVLASGASLCLGGCASPLQPPATLMGAARSARLPDTLQHDLTDPASGHTWRVWVQRPSGPAPATGHPVLWVLDGNAAFALAAQLARNDAARPTPVRPDSTLVVGIGHPADAPYTPAWRQRDYTPPEPGQAATPESGGADALLDFLARVLQPWAARTFAIDPQRQTLSGHSFGGLFVLHALFTRPMLFSRYAAASPSIWWGQTQVLRSADRFVARHSGAERPFNARLQLRVGGLETAEAAATPERAAVQTERRIIDNAQTLAHRLNALRWPELTADFAICPGLDHGGVMAQALIDALALAQRPR